MLNPLPAKKASTRSLDLFNLVTFTIGTKAANTINVACQLKDAKGRVLRQVAHVRVHLSDVSTGAGITTTATTSALAIGTNGVIVNIPVTGKVVDVLSDAQGRFDLNLIQTASPLTYYMAVQMPDGSVSMSNAIVF
jgi:hypothetical protein